jgi:hypothetical protein
MTTEEKVPRMLLKILTATGQEKIHYCNLPAVKDAAISFVSEMIWNIVEATSGMQTASLVVPGKPSIIYNSRWIVGVEYSFIGAEDAFEDSLYEVSERARKSQKKPQS